MFLYMSNTQKRKETATGLNRTKKKHGLKHFPTYFPSEKEKEIICNKLNRTTSDDLVVEYNKLKNLSCLDIKNKSAETRIGNKIVDYFTLIERLHTAGQQKIDFYTFWKHRAYFKKIPYVQKMLEFYESRDTDEICKFKYIFNLYFSSISIFRPLMAMELYCKVSARRVLDFTMGWGGRLLGAHVLNLESYIGIDLNTELRLPYTKMVSFLREREKDSLQKKPTEIQLLFKDALHVDYSTLDYDTVFTSPPYYDYEEYRHMKKYDWKDEFYDPIIKTTWKYLKKNGHYCLNVPEDIYRTVCVPILGESQSKHILKKKKRSKNAKYKEFIYIWKKVE